MAWLRVGAIGMALGLCLGGPKFLTAETSAEGRSIDAIRAALGEPQVRTEAVLPEVSVVAQRAEANSSGLFSLGMTAPPPDLTIGWRPQPSLGFERHPLHLDNPTREAGVGYEVSIAAPLLPRGLDVGVAHRAELGESADGRFAARGAQVRVGQGLAKALGEFQSPTWDNPSWYFFAGSDGQALTWTPAAASADPASRLRYQERVTVGDLQAGFSIEAAGMQASLSYMQREVSNARLGSGDRTRSENEQFVGATLTWRR